MANFGIKWWQLLTLIEWLATSTGSRNVSYKHGTPFGYFDRIQNISNGSNQWHQVTSQP